jgi:hypothetical protein
MGDKWHTMEWPRSPVPYFLCQDFFVISLDAGVPLGVYLPHREARNSDPDERGG